MSIKRENAGDGALRVNCRLHTKIDCILSAITMIEGIANIRYDLNIHIQLRRKNEARCTPSIGALVHQFLNH